MRYIIKFSSDKIGVSGKPISEEIESVVRDKTFPLKLSISQLEDGPQKKELSHELLEVECAIKENVKDMRATEKDILDHILAEKLKATAKASEAYAAQDFADRIRHSDDCIIFDSDDLKSLEVGYEKATKMESWFRVFGALMRQIMRPVEYKEPEKPKEPEKAAETVKPEAQTVQ